MQAFGFQLKARSGERLISVEDYRRSARRKIPRMAWAFVEGGAEDGASLRANRDAFSRWALVPRVLTGNGTPQLKTTIAGQQLDMPVLIGPTGFSGVSNWRGDIAAARAAERMGTRMVLSTASSWSIEEVRQATRENHIFQLYPRSGSTVVRSLLERASASGYSALVVTVDVPVIGNREDERRTGMTRPPTLAPRTALDFARHPRWTASALRHGRIGGRNLVENQGWTVKAAAEAAAVQEAMLQSTFDWQDLKWIRDHWDGPLYVKGILHPDDAAAAVDLGVQGIFVSNHGGRQLDHAVPPLEALPAIAEQVGDRAEIILDGGIRRGSDVLKALALGAHAVALGRAYLYGLAVNGEDGVADVLKILREELSRDMALTGCPNVQAAGRQLLHRREL